jgi:PilZ domain
MLDTSDGLRTACGQIVDLSVGGCAIRVHRIIEADLAGRVQVEVAGKSMWLPVITRWVCADSRGWTVGCAFDRLTPEKQRLISTLLLERRSLTA